MFNTLSNVLFIFLPPLQMYLHRSYVEVFGKGKWSIVWRSGSEDVPRHVPGLAAPDSGGALLSIFPRHALLAGSGERPPILHVPQTFRLFPFQLLDEISILWVIMAGFTLW